MFQGIQKLAATTAVLTGLFAGTAFAETELVMSSWLPPRHPIVVGAMKPWAKQIEEVTEGRVTVRILARPLGAPPAHYDMAAEGVADITYGLHSFTTDERFQRSRIGQFSFLGDDAVSGSVAFWNVYSGMLDAQAEHKGTKVLGLFVHGPGMLHNNTRKIETKEDIAGLKIRTPGGYIADLMGELGASTLFMSSGEVYEKLSRGVIDGVTFPYDAIAAFNLGGDLTNTTKVPGGLYNTTWFLVMNEGKWNEISAEDQAAIESISGKAFAELVGTAWNGADEKGLAAANEAGIQIDEAPEALVATIAELAAGYEKAWSDAIAADGFDGAAALTALRAETGVEY
ncbi:TRAP transporter substrate-binding protein [Donghicola tyrosinivorans]|uniref:TRAP-type C4-dicarboxylate transport system substrate-binding protein n=1 Tax=Donghicola tyrosinivorans TaxID=1652492 RepID=A0A2T0WNQ0_9RHOB|nr:TRAP transporter substrate-binding protein [Donghicola tyrosinivorans]PRY88312.1 TRAP-type C4-dicarboxylate transport system substrate-binding protein [Donghicola tyrosinivorans]